MVVMSTPNYSKKPSAPKPVANVSAPIVDAPEVEELLVSDEAVTVEVVEAAAVSEPAPDEDMEEKEKVTAPAAAPSSSNVSKAPSSAYAIVSSEKTDKVYLSKIIFKNIFQKKSLSVHHLQRRLAEWGIASADLDKDGYYGDGTLIAIGQFQVKVGLTHTGSLNAETLKAVFENDNNVTVVID
jgi:hypothetical protein